ncbi:RTA1 like protein-domain-containing protein [Calycina marina]|uniref:RTA1 like protein-domain-containing protein n=1 Tax=Calycina marina TaxID=1763456 RepID=A0A9P7Z072_9HELO|nr:RTA1 like protein-domain-containing protein [Calycina marina]
MADSSFGYTDPSFPPPDTDAGDAPIIIYGYTPNLVLCILGIVLFTIAFVAHLFQVLRYRIWSFLPLTVACVLEIVGYVFRSLSSKVNPYRVVYFVVQYFFIVTAPVLVSASIYVCLTHFLSWADKSESNFSRSWFLGKKFILWTFITIDVITTIIQVAGAALIGVAESNQDDSATANNILLVGLAIQCFAFLVYLLLLSIVTVKMLKSQVLKERIKQRKPPFILILWLSSILVYLRTLFRLIETSEGVYGKLSTHEAYFGGLEFAPMVVAVWLLAIWHPGRWPSNFKREEMRLSKQGA